MKLLVFAHTPPPHHGQSYMVKLMMEGFGGNRRRRAHRTQPAPMGIECYQVNARLSKDLEDIGSVRPQKFVVLLFYCLQAIWCRFRFKVRTLYYVPAPGKKSAIWRDWVVMALCRPFFDRLVLHWHAAGQARWLETAVSRRTRGATYRALGQASLSIVLSNWSRGDAEKLLPQRVSVVGNGIPDPCPDFREAVLPIRHSRLAQRLECLSGTTGSDPANAEVRVLFLAHCTRQKGLFDALEGVRMANERMRNRGTAMRFRLTAGGNFLDEQERLEFETLAAREDEEVRPRHVGFVSGQAKQRLFTEADVFCFPTYFYAESFGLVVLEALAFGLPVVTTRWRSLPEVLPSGYAGLVEPRAPQQIAEALIKAANEGSFEASRRHFLDRFLIDRHLDQLAQALKSTP